MKRSWIIALFALMLWPTAVSAQGMDFASLVDKYKGRMDCTTVELTGESLRFLEKSSSGGNGSDTHNDFGIERIRIVINEPASAVFEADMNKVATGADFNLLSSIVKGDKTTGIYYKKMQANPESPLKSELLLIVATPGKNVAIDITGAIDIKNISGIREMGLEGM